MIKVKYIASVCLFFLLCQKNIAQTKTTNTQKDIKSSEEKGYQEFLKYDAQSKLALKNQKHKHTPYETNKEVEETVIYISPKKVSNTGCVNMGFDQYSFSGWTGEYGATTIGASGAGVPNFSITGNSIVNTAGNNVSLTNTINYHTLMTKPAINPIYPICNGYDSIACKVIGTNTVSQIPVVSPYSQDLVSVRLNGAAANYRASRLKYITTTSAANQQISYSFATVMDNAGHLPNESPYFKVEVKDESTGMLLSGCNSYTINPSSAVQGDSLLSSAIGFSISYRKWQLVSVDLSSLPLGTNVSVTFEVGSCAQGGHWGYAYVDAECSSNNVVSSNMCAGSSFASLVAPQGMLSYQWLNSSSIPIAGETNDTLIVNTPNIGDVYSVQMTAIGGCTTTKTIAVSSSTISINNIISSGSCVSGNSGIATVYSIGTNGVYSYTWTSISTGSVVGNSQTVANLSPGIYSVTVESGTCGQATGTISVPITPLQLTSQIKLFCGNKTHLVANPLSTNIKWYNGLVLLPNTNDTLLVNNPNTNDQYTLVSSTPQGCVDSILYVLVQNNTNSVIISNINNTCSGSTNGSAIINLYSSNSGPFNYEVYGPSGLVTNTTANTSSLSLTALAVGNYTTTVYEGICIHTQTFTVNTIANNYTITPGVLNSCNPNDTVRVNFNFGNGIPSSCGLSSSGSCASPNQITIGTGTLTNTSATYPAIYGNWYRNSRHQILYRANELLAAGVLPGKLSSIAFNVNTISGTTIYPDFTIKMKCTTDTSLISPSFDQAGLSQVFYDDTIIVNTGWNTYQFPTAYEWDGVSNILVDVCNSITTSFTQNSLSPYTTTPFASVRWYYSDATLACPVASGNSFSPNNTYRPNVIFGNCGVSLSSSYTISVSSNGSITHNYNNDSIKIVPIVTPTAGITYTISVINPQGGCVSSVPFSLITPTLVVAGTNAVCEGTSVYLNVSGANAYTWNTGATTSSIVVTPTTTSVYSVTGTDLNNCSNTQTVSVTVDNTCQDVWPGDANSDGMADNLDVLELGLHYTQTGAPRTSVSNTWQSYVANNWTGTISNGKNLNHSDCNGDGTINDDDTLAIFNNYGLIHAFKPEQAAVINPQLSIIPDQAYVTKGNWGTASIYAGDAVTSITNINGLAFTVDFDNTLIEPSNIWIEYLPSFIDVSQNLHFRKLDFSNAKIFTATTHTVNNNVSGNGKIATLHYQIKSNLTTDEVLNIGLSQANQSNASGVITPLTTGTGTLMAIGASVGLQELNGNMISISPNPTNGSLTIRSKIELQKIEVIAVTGQILLSEVPTSVSYTLHLDNLSNGIYFVNIYAENKQPYMRKVIVQK